MSEEYYICEVCGIDKNVRFESSEEKYLCDGCLEEIKRNNYIELERGLK